jgi:hypothetical protein
MNKELILLNQIIEMAEVQEKDLRILNQSRHKSCKTEGEGALLFHLKQLKELLELNSKNVSLGGKDLTISFGMFEGANINSGGTNDHGWPD